MATPDQTRTAVVTAAVVVTLLAVAGAAALVLGLVGGGERLASTPPTSAPVPAPPAAAPSPSPAASVSPAPSEPAPWEVDAAFLPPEQAGAAEEPGWEIDDAHEAGPGPVLDPCVDGTFPGSPVASAERAMRSVREAGGSVLVQEVLRYPDPDAAAGAFDAFAERVAACPEAPDPEAEGFTVRFEVTASEESAGARTMLVQYQPCGPEQTCTSHFRSYLLVAQAGDGLTTAAHGLGEDGDPADAAAALLEAVSMALQSAVAG